MIIDMLAQSVVFGGYIAIWKVIIFVVLFGFWAWIGQWLDKDTELVNTSRNLWNGIYFSCGVGVFLSWFVLPAVFLVELLLFLVIWSAVTVIYVLHRNARVEHNETIMTKDHIRWLIHNMGKSRAKETKLRLEFISVNDNDLPVPDKFDDEYAGYVVAEELLHDMWIRRVSHAELSPKGESFQLRYVIDGIASAVDEYEFEDSVAGINYLKAVAGLDVLDRRRPQTGSFFTIRTGEETIGWRIFTSGSTHGEQLTLERIQDTHDLAIDGIGLHPDQLKQIDHIIREQKTGMVLVCGGRGSGVSTTLYSMIRRHDAFIQNIHSLELNLLTELDNVTQHKIEKGPKAPSHARQLQSVLHVDPDVVMIGFCDEPEIARLGIRFVGEGKKIFIGMEGSGVFGVLADWIKMIGNNEKVSQTLSAITYQKMLRKLCPECREAYMPDANLLKRLNLPAGKIKQFYRPPSEVIYDKRGNPILCENCQGTGYFGRTAVFETLFISEAVRKLIAQDAPIDTLRTQCRKEKVLYLQEQAIRKVIDGTTSIQEVIRITTEKKKTRKQAK